MPFVKSNPKQEKKILEDSEVKYELDLKKMSCPKIL